MSKNFMPEMVVLDTTIDPQKSGAHNWGNQGGVSTGDGLIYDTKGNVIGYTENGKEVYL